jgi:hypothetical protein
MPTRLEGGRIPVLDQHDAIVVDWTEFHASAVKLIASRMVSSGTGICIFMDAS